MSVTDDDDTVAVSHEHEKRARTLMIAQLFRFSGHHISEILSEPSLCRIGHAYEDATEMARPASSDVARRHLAF